MSCDTDISFRLKAQTLAELEAGIKWQRAKEKAYKKLEKVRNKDDKWMKKNGFTRGAEFVTWGWDFQSKPRKTPKEKSYQVKCYVWANENGRNVPATGSNGELVYFVEKNPKCWIEGEYKADSWDEAFEGELNIYWDEDEEAVYTDEAGEAGEYY